MHIAGKNQYAVVTVAIFYRLTLHMKEMDYWLAIYQKKKELS
jgi:hypothetical protein